MIKAFLQCFEGIHVYASGRRDETLVKASSLGAEAHRDNDYVVRNSDVVFLSVKPYHFPVLYSQVNRGSWEGKVVVSVMAGVKLETLEKALVGAEVFRAMPNINAFVGRSTTAVATNNVAVRNESRDLVDKLFRCLGTVYWVPEEYLDIWTGLVGSGPAFIAEIIDGLVLGAVASGMSREVAYNAVLDMIDGTVKLLKELKIHPIEVRDEVTTPAGTTINGLKVFESKGVKAGLMEIVETAYKRSVEIGNEVNKAIKTKLQMI